MGFDLCVYKKTEKGIEEFVCKYNEGRPSGRHEIVHFIITQCKCLWIGEFLGTDSAYYRPEYNDSYEKCKDKVIALGINVDFWLGFLKFIDANTDIYLNNSY